MLVKAAAKSRPSSRRQVGSLICVRLTACVDGKRADLVVFPLRELNAYVADVGITGPKTRDVAQRILFEWSKLENAARRLPPAICELGCGQLAEFRALMEQAGMSAAGMAYLEDERERAMNRVQQRQSRERKRMRQQQIDGSYTHQAHHQARSSIESNQQSAAYFQGMMADIPSSHALLSSVHPYLRPAPIARKSEDEPAMPPQPRGNHAFNSALKEAESIITQAQGAEPLPTNAPPPLVYMPSLAGWPQVMMPDSRVFEQGSFLPAFAQSNPFFLPMMPSQFTPLFNSLQMPMQIPVPPAAPPPPNTQYFLP